MTASTLVGAPRGAVLEAATRSSVPKGESSAHDIGLCGAAAVDLLSRRFGVAGEPVDLLQFASTVVTLGDVADALEGRGMSARFVEGLTRAQLDSLAPDECVILVLTPEVEGRSAHLLVGIPSKQDGFVLLDPIGPWPDRPISFTSTLLDGWGGDALLVAHDSRSIPALDGVALGIAACAAATAIAAAIGWKLGARR